MAVALAGTFGTASVQAQGPTSAREQSERGRCNGTVGAGRCFAAFGEPDAQPARRTGSTATDGKSSAPDAPTATGDPAESNNPDGFGKQPKRILGIIPNYRAVSANTHLPPLSFKSELWLATQDTFDYSDFIFVGGLAGVSMASKSQPSFGQGAAGYGRYYWHVFVDGAIENYMTEAIVPAVTKEDPRYYTWAKADSLSGPVMR
jgi:hypothetical protein